MRVMDATLSSVIDETQRAFDGYPYLVTRLVAALNHIILLPRAWLLEQLLQFGRRQACANRLPTCLVLAGDLCVYYGEDGRQYRSAEIPRSAYIVMEKLAPAEPIPESAELAVRRSELKMFEEAQRRIHGTGYLVGDILRGGRPPTPDEEERLAGTHADGGECVRRRDVHAPGAILFPERQADVHLNDARPFWRANIRRITRTRRKASCRPARAVQRAAPSGCRSA